MPRRPPTWGPAPAGAAVFAVLAMLFVVTWVRTDESTASWAWVQPVTPTVMRPPPPPRSIRPLRAAPQPEAEAEAAAEAAAEDGATLGGFRQWRASVLFHHNTSWAAGVVQQLRARPASRRRWASVIRGPANKSSDAAQRAGFLGCVLKEAVRSKDYLVFVNGIHILREANVSITDVAWAEIIVILDHQQQWQLLLHTYRLLDPRRLESTFRRYFVLNRVMWALKELGRWEEAEGHLAAYEEAGLAPATKAYNVLLVALLAAGQPQRVVQHFEAMQRRHCAPDRLTFNVVLSAFARVGGWEAAAGALRRMRDARISPDVLSYNMAIAACQEAGEV
eukprot:EG_transcript_18746